MMSRRAETIAEAEAQDLDLPEFEDWRRYAGRLDGYAILEEMGEGQAWINEHRGYFEANGVWDASLSVLELRVLLFYVFRSDYMSGWTYTEHDPIVDALLQALSAKTGKPYTPKG